jgi:hypothetical protein
MSHTLGIAFALSARLDSALHAGRVRSVAIVALAVLMAAPVKGQTLAGSFDELRFKVKAGDTVYITNDGGQSEQKAQILDLSPSSLAVSIGGVRRDLGESNVARIRQRLPDSKKNGALIGFLVGAAGSVAMAQGLDSPDGSCRASCIGANVLYGGGIGALIGLGIDALIQGRKDIYARSARRSSLDFHVHPSVTSQAKTLNMALRF